MSTEFPRSTELDRQVAAVFAEIQEAGLRALRDEEGDHGDEFGGESSDVQAFTTEGGVGVCRIIIDGVPSGCYPGVTRSACRRIANKIGADAHWDEHGSC